MKRTILATLIIFIFLASTASAATLTVPTKYKTIQKAVDSAKDGDIIYVNAGVYKENVLITGKDLTFQGQKVKNTYKYPTVYGFKFKGTQYKKSSGNVNGFKITKSGVYYDYGMGGNSIIRNNYFYNCGINLNGFSCSYNTVMNNKFSGNYDYIGVNMYESQENVITGNTFTKAKIGINCGESSTYTDSKNTYVSCKVKFN